MKKSLLSLSLCCSLILSLPLSLFAQNPPNRQQQEQTISIKTAEVVLDVLVKDKKGRVVKDLNAADFEVFEDGAKQQIESFRLVTRAGSNNPEPEKKEVAPTASEPAGKAINLAAGESDVGISAIALVFDRLSQDARKRARDAAMNYAGEESRPNDFIGVFNIDLSLKVLQNYTTDNRLIREAIDKAGSMVSSTFNSNAAQARSQDTQIELLRQQVASSEAAASSAGGSGNGAAAGAAGSAAGAASVDLKFAEMTRRTLETFEALERDQQGYATSNGLLAVVNSMRSLPGRKAVIFFSEGLAIPPNVATQFRSVIDQANRINVSVYSVDSAGLRAINPNDEARAEINALGRRRVDADSTRPELGGPMTAKLERNEDLLRLNPQSGLTQLAQETGGAFIGDTSNISNRLRQVDEDLHTYYLVSYSPNNQNLDGRFREISVKLKRNDYDVTTRKGYYAVNVPGHVPMLYYETQPLAALNNPTIANAFPMHMQGFNFPDASRKLQTAIEVKADAASFTFAEDKGKKIFSTNFTILALIKDESKQVVSKLSRQYVLNGPLDKLKATRSGAVLFYKETELPPGKYEIEAVAFDEPTGKASVRRSNLEIPEPDESKLRLSSVAIIQSVEKVSANQKAESPFQVGEVMLYPNLGEAFKKSATKQVGFYFVVYPGKGAKAIQQFTLQVSQGNKMVADLQLKLPAADADGRIPFASALPADSLSPGVYELRITVKDDKTSVTRTRSFTIES